ncbi:partitioning defective 3 homolog B-like, partial [Pectinophora gossypiella]
MEPGTSAAAPAPVPPLRLKKLARIAANKEKARRTVTWGPETWVGVRALRASSGGILDPDDRVRDVADDRETLTAECTAQAPQPRAAQADGASGSSAGTASPDMFRGGGGVGGSMRVPNSESCVEVGAGDLEDGASGLQVRRGSEPTLHQDTLPPQRQVTEQTKRWSAAVVCREDSARATQKVLPLPEGRPPDPPPHSAHFQRQTNRLSMQFSGPGSGVWLDAAERIQTYGSKSLPRDARREPLGQDTSVTVTPVNNHQNHRVEDMLRWVSGVNNVANVHPVQERPLDLLPEVGNSERAISGLEVPVSPSSKPASGATQAVSVTLVKGEKGLGFTITTRDNPTGGHCPIYIKNILPKGAAVTDGRLRAGDRLVSVNGVSVAGLTQQQVVALLRNTPTDSTVDIVVERPAPNRTQRVEPQQSPAKFTEKSIGSPNSITTKHTETKTENRVSSIVNAINNNNANSSIRGRIPKSSSKDDLLKKDQSNDNSLQDVLNSSSSSVLGLRNKLILRLDVPVHDSEKAGLGISVKGKVTVGSDPQDLGIFIKSVLHGGAASRDGRLHTNDQLLSVNGVSLVGQSNAEAMETLRRALLHSRPHVHGSISLTIARRTDSLDSLARWKDDTPPNGNDTTNSNETPQNFNTVIYNSSSDKENKPIENFNQNSEERGIDSHDGRGSKKHASIITINNNTSWVSNQSDDSKGYLERDKDTVPHDPKRDSFEWSRLDGWNPVIDRLTGLRNE